VPLLTLLTAWNSWNSCCLADVSKSTDKPARVGIGSIDFKAVEESFPELRAFGQLVDDFGALAQTEDEVKGSMSKEELESHKRLQEVVGTAAIIRAEEQQKITDGIAALASLAGIDVVVDKSAIFLSNEKISVIDVTNRLRNGLKNIDLSLDTRSVEKYTRELEKARPRVELGTKTQE